MINKKGFVGEKQEYNQTTVPVYDLPKDLKYLQKQHQEEIEKQKIINQIIMNNPEHGEKIITSDEKTIEELINNPESIKNFIKEENKKNVEEKKEKKVIKTKEERNESLIKSMKSLVEESVYETFKKSSIKFQKGIISPEEYYLFYVSTFPPKESKEMFRDLVELMPEKFNEKKKLLIKSHEVYTGEKFLKSKNETNEKKIKKSVSVDSVDYLPKFGELEIKEKKKEDEKKKFGEDKNKKNNQNVLNWSERLVKNNVKIINNSGNDKNSINNGVVIKKKNKKL
jgi:hypothetical protein